MSAMYGRRRIILQKPRGTRGWVVDAGKRSLDSRGGSYHPLGVWYERDGVFYADLKNEAQEYQLVSVAELGIKAFGGTATKAALRDAIAQHRGIA
jgi:hypothetical protein